MIAKDAAFISVNGIAIAQVQIDQEMMNHSALTDVQARQTSIRALVVRELLLQEAIKWSLCDLDGAINKPDEAIDKLLARQIKVPSPDEASCERYFEENRDNFLTAPVFEASHIFFPAHPGDEEMRSKAKNKAMLAVQKIKDNPDCFADIARQQSACSSASNGGRLGHVAKGQTVPAFESALMVMSKGEISALPVETEVGFHIIRLDDREGGENMPFDMLKSWIFETLTAQRREKAISGYVRGLADQAQIGGFDFDLSEPS